MAEDTENPDKTCDLCHISYFNDEELKEHSYSLMHHIKIECRKKGSVHHCTLCFGTYTNLALYSTHLNEEKHRSAVQLEKKGKEKELDFTKPNNVETASSRFGSQKSLGSTQDKGKDKSVSSEETQRPTRWGKGAFESQDWHKGPKFDFGPNNRSSSTLNLTVDNLSDINTSNFESNNWDRPGGPGNWKKPGDPGNWNGQAGPGIWNGPGGPGNLNGPGNWNGPSGPSYLNGPSGAGSSWYGNQWFNGPEDRSYVNTRWSSNNSLNNSGTLGNRNQSFNNSFNDCQNYDDFTKNSIENFRVPTEPPQGRFSRWDRSPRDAYKANLGQQGRGGPRYGNKIWINPKCASSSKYGKGKVSPRDGIKGKRSPNERSKKSPGGKKKIISPKNYKKSTQSSLDRSRSSIESGDEVSSTTRVEGSMGWRDLNGSRVGASLSGVRYGKSKSPARSSTKKTTKAPSSGTLSKRKSQDKGSALLTRAEDLCKAVRKTRMESKERTESELRKVESQLVETKLQSYSDLCRSQMKGYVSTDMLSDLDKSISELTSAQSTSTVELTSAQSTSTVDMSKNVSGEKKASDCDLNKESSKDGEVVKDVSNDLNKKKDVELNNNEKSPSKEKVQKTPASSSPSVRKDGTKTVAKSAVDTAKVNFVKQNVAPLNKNNLMKIINAPRSHKERMQLANLMKSTKPKSVRPRLNLQPQEPAVVADLVESVSNDFGVSESEFIAFESLPDDLRVKVEKLLNEGPDNLSDSEMCFSDIEGVEYPFTSFDNCAVEAPLVELPNVNLNGKRRRAATSSTETLTRGDSAPQLESKKQKINEQDHSSVEISLPPNNQRPVRDLDPGSTTDCSSRSSQLANKSLTSSYADWTRTNDLSPARQLSGSTGPHSVGASTKTVNPVKAYSTSNQSQSSHASNGEKAKSGTTYTFGNKSFIPPFTSTSHSNSSIGSKSPLRSSGTVKSPLAYSDGDYARESRSPPIISVKREPVWEKGYGVGPSSTANYTSSQTTIPSQKPSHNFQTSSIFSSNFSLHGAVSQAADVTPIMNRHSQTSSVETESISIAMTPPRSRTATESTVSSGRPSIENSLGKAGCGDSSYYISGQNRSSLKPMDQQSYHSASSHSHSSSASKFLPSSMTSAPSSMPSALTSTPSASNPMPFASTSMTYTTTSMPSAIQQKSPSRSRSSSSPSQILSPKSALTSASQALETANTALASINTNLGFNIPVQDINSLELDSSASALSGTSDPINRVLQITIKEEEIRNKLSTVNNHVETLGSLMTKLQGEFDKFKTLQTNLETEGQNLRQERLSILQGAVAEKQVSDMVKEVTSGIRKPTETSPTQIRRSSPKDGEMDSPQAQSISEPSSAQSSFSIPGVMPLPNAESSPVKVKEEVVPEMQLPVATSPAPVIQLRPVPESQQIVAQPAVAGSEIVADAQTASTSSMSCVDFTLKQEPEEMETDLHIQKQTDENIPKQTENQSLMSAVFANAVIKQEGTVPPDSCTPVEMEYVGSLKTANEAQDLLKEIASNLKDTSFIIVEGGEYLKRSKDEALAKSKDVGVQMAGNYGFSTTDYDSSLSDVQVIELTPNKDPKLLHNILKSPDAHCADNSYDRLLKKDTFSEKERFKALLLETVDTSMKLGVTPEEPDSSDTSPAKIAIAVKEKALEDCHVVLERLDKDLMGMIDCTSTSGISSARAKPKSKKVKGDESSMMIPDSPTLRRKMKKTKKERNRSRANVADSSSETQVTESEFTVSRTTNSNSSRDELRKSGVCFTASDVEALGSSANVSFDVGVGLEENDTSTLVGSQTTEFGPAEESELTVTSSSDVDSYQMKERLKISSQTANVIRNKLLQSAMVEVKPVKNVPTPGLFEGHTMPVFSMQIFENFLFSCSQDTTVRKFDTSTHQCISEFRCHARPIHCLRVTRCGSKFRERLFTGATDALLLEHDALTGEFLSRVILADKVHCMHEQWSMLYVGLGNGQVVCYDLLKSRVAKKFACGEKPISCITSSQEGPRKILLVASFDSSITVRDAKNGLLLRCIDGHLKTPLAVIEKDNCVYSGSADRTIRLHELNSGESVLTITMKGPVTALALTGKYLLTASYDGIIRCYNTEESFKLKQIYYGAGKTLIMDMILHYDMIYTANREGTIEAIPFDTSLRYPCKFRDCGVTFGLSTDLRYHIFHDHLPEQIKNDRYHCNWHGCYDKLNVETNQKNLEDHISGHISEVEGTVCSESP